MNTNIKISRSKNSHNEPKIATYFSKLLPQQTVVDEELSIFEDRLKNEDGFAVFAVWKEENLLLTDYFKFAYCKKHNIPYDIIYLSFASRKEAVEWVGNNQLQRLNLNSWQRGKLAVDIWRKDYEKQANANKKMSQGRGKKGRKISNDVFKPIDVRQKLANKAGLSRDTMNKILTIIDYKKNKEVVENLDNGEISIAQGFNDVKRMKKAESKKNKNLTIFPYTNDLSKGIENNVIHTKVLEGLKLVPDNSVSLIFTSPPFNVSMDYKIDKNKDSLKWKDYLAWLKEVFAACYPKLRKGGRIAIEIEQIKTREKEDQSFEYRRPIEAELLLIMREIGYCYRDTIIWDKGKVGNNAAPWTSCGYPDNPKIRPMHSNILIYSKEQWELPCITNDLSEIQTEEYNELTKSIWRIPTGAKNPTSHVCPFPLKLAENIVKLLSFKNDLVMDVFGGSGTVAVACVKNQRRFIHLDASETYCKEAKDWIQSEQESLNASKKAA